MNPFTYAHPADVAAALAAKPIEGRFIAGGTNLLDLMKENVARVPALVDINQLQLAGIAVQPDGGLRLGALARNAHTAYHPAVREDYPLLSSAILAGASPQIRNMASNGGNLLQRTRCVYFYDTATPCNKRAPGSGCPAVHGLARQHAILGASDACIATHPSDMCVALAALDARVNVQSPSGDRTIAFADFHRLPGDQPEKDTILQDDELITSIDIPAAQRFKAHAVYLKIRERSSYAFALVSVAAMLELDGAGVITDARVAMGGVAHKPWTRTEANVALIGKQPGAAVFDAFARLLLDGARSYGEGAGSNAFKLPMAHRAVVRALEQAAQGTVTNHGDNIDG